MFRSYNSSGYGGHGGHGGHGGYSYPIVPSGPMYYGSYNPYSTDRRPGPQNYDPYRRFGSFQFRKIVCHPT